MKLMIMDGQGGGIGAAIIKSLRDAMAADAQKTAQPWRGFPVIDPALAHEAAQRELVRLLAWQEAGGKLFIVGDAKQSIYRFRRAEPRLFSDNGL